MTCSMHVERATRLRTNCHRAADIGTKRFDGWPIFVAGQTIARIAIKHLMFALPAAGLASAELRFIHRGNDLKSLAFPCDAAGRVDLDALDEHRRNQYLFARVLMGRDYAFPVLAWCDR